MNKIIITGFSGFVGKNFADYIDKNLYNTSILGIDILYPKFDISHYHNTNVKFEKTDLKDREKVSKLIYDFSPDCILHLASYSSVSGSWKKPGNSFQNNVNIFLNLLEDVRMTGINCRIISVGSSEEYGITDISNLPLKENQTMNPASPFGIARFSQELIGKLYADVYGMDIIMTRSFNHIGPGQSEDFAISSFAKQLSEIKKNGGSEFVTAGDVTVIRDFTDVRDVVRAYHKLFLKGKKGEIYNVCSGYGISLQNIIQMMCEILDLKIIIREDKKLRRPKDNPVIIGSNIKMKNEIDWVTTFSLEDSLKDMIRYYLTKNENLKSIEYQH